MTIFPEDSAVNPVVAEVVRSGFFALADGNGVRAGAVKIDDGAARARTPVTVAALRGLGAVVPDELATVPVTGGDAVVGAVRAVRLDGGRS